MHLLRRIAWPVPVAVSVLLVAGAAGQVSGAQATTAHTVQAATLGASDAPAPLSAGSLTAEHQTDPLGIDTGHPRLGWVVTSAARGASQQAYQVRVSTAAQVLGHGPWLWDSGIVHSARSFDVPYGGPALQSTTRYFWQVRVWDNGGNVSPWSQPASFETAFLNPGQFQGSWIGGSASSVPSLAGANWIWYPEGQPGGASFAPGTRYLRDNFDIPSGKSIKSAQIEITADDSYVLYVNGTQAATGNNWQQAQLVDLTSTLKAGSNTIAASDTNGGSSPNPAGLIAKLEVQFTDGSSQQVVTDGSWKAAQQVPNGWQQPGFDDSSWPGVLVEDPYGTGPWGSNVSAPNANPELLLRKNFDLGSQAIARARLYVAGLSYPYLSINGQPVSDHVLDTAFTSFDKTVDYNTYDVTRLVRSGSDAIAASLGNGFYAGGADDYPGAGEPWQPAQPKLKLELDVRYANGASTQVVSDPSWKVSTGPTTANSAAAETYDARLEQPGWNQLSYNDSGWANAAGLPAPAGVLRAQLIPPIEKTATINPAGSTQPQPDTKVYDFGITTSGWTRITMQGTAGTRVQIMYSERLNPDGTVESEGNGGGGQVDTYILKGGGPETYEPKYGWKGYRYVEVTASSCGSTSCAQPLPKILSVSGIVAHTALPGSGDFQSSSGLFNNMHVAMRNTILNNQYSYGSDTPVYEKGGWTNDNGDYATSEMANFDAQAYYDHTMQNFDDSQQSSGDIGWLVPSSPGFNGTDPLWGGSFLLLENDMLQNYDDLATISRDYSHMAAYMDYMADQIAPSGYIYMGATFGDWSVPGNANPPSSEMLGSMFLYREASDLATMATAVGNSTGAAKYNQLASTIAAAVNNKFYDAASHDYRDPPGIVSHAYGGPNGVVTSTAYDQTANAIGLAFGLAPAQDRQAVADGLAADVAAKGNHLATGANGSKYILPALTEAGYGDLAYKVATNPTSPGWGQWFSQCGATTMWESWEDSSCATARSRDHAFMGTVDDWLFSGVAGIQPTSPGFQRVQIRPSYPAAGLNHASAYQATPLGRVSSTWTSSGSQYRLTVEIPVGSQATVFVPAASAQSVTESGQPAGQAAGVHVVGMQGRYLELQAGSGTYMFQSTTS